jgi:hypothetical protein
MRLVPGQIDARKTKPTFTKRQEFHKDVKKKHPRKNLLLKTPKLQLWWSRPAIQISERKIKSPRFLELKVSQT